MAVKRVDYTTMNIPRSVVTLAWPVVLRMSLQMIVGVVDLSMVGSLGAAAIASVGIGNNLLWLIISATTAFSVGTTAYVARNIGAKDYRQASEVARQSIVITFLVALVLGIVSVIFTPQIIRLMIIAQEQPDPLVMAYGIQYFKITAFSFPFFFTLTVLNGILQGSGDTKTPLKVMIFANIFNVVFDYFLIFGIGPFPEMGVGGAALASALARILGFCISLYVLLAGRTGFKLFWDRKFSFDWDILRGVVNIGLPAAGEQLVNNGGTTLLTVLVAGLGTAALAANQVVLRGLSIANMPAFGFNMAATTLVGQNLGARNKERAEQTGYTASKMAAIFMLIFGIILFVFAKYVVLFFTREPDVVSLATTALRIVCLSMPFLGIQLTFAGALRGAGDTWWVLLVTIVGVLGSRLFLAFFLIVVLGVGFSGVWIAYSLDFAIRAGFFYLRYRSGRWKSIKLRKEEKLEERIEVVEIAE